MPAVATTARASDPAQAVTASARAGDADSGRFARLVDTAKGTAGGQPSTDPTVAANSYHRPATPEQLSPADKPALGKPVTGKPAADKPAVDKQAVPEARQTAGPAEDSAPSKQTSPQVHARNEVSSAAEQTAKPQASPQPASGQGKAEAVPHSTPTGKPGAGLAQPIAGPAQGKMSGPEPAAPGPAVPGPAVPGRPTRSGDSQLARTPRPGPEPAVAAHQDTTQGQDSAAAATLGAAAPNAPGAAPASTDQATAQADQATPASAQPGIGAPGPDATTLSGSPSTTRSMEVEAASGAPTPALPSDPSIGRPVAPRQSDGAKVDSAASALAAVAAPAGVAQQISTATTADPVVTGPMLPRVAGETGEPVAIRIARAARDGDKTLTMELHPADLGRVEVRLSFHANGVGVQMTLDKPETFEAFSRNRAGLEQQLAQAGINLGDGGLDLRLGQQGGQPEAERRPTNFRTQAGSYAISPPALPQVIAWAGQGLVDIVA